jgi:hypothetical protein
MLAEKAKGVRKKLRELRLRKVAPLKAAIVPKRRHHSHAPARLAESALSVTSACAAAAAGFELCARRTRDATIGVAAASAAGVVRALSASIVTGAEARHIDARPRPRTCDRLRWEWLFSTGTVVDGHPERRLLAECARILGDTLAAAATLRAGLGEEIAARLRLASAEAHSLALAVEYERTADERNWLPALS